MMGFICILSLLLIWLFWVVLIQDEDTYGLDDILAELYGDKKETRW